MKENKCKSCGGKGTYSQFHGGGEFGDSFEGHVYVAPKIENHPCKVCQKVERPAFHVDEELKEAAKKAAEAFEGEEFLPEPPLYNKITSQALDIGKTMERMRILEILHEYALLTVKTETLDLIEKIQQEIINPENNE